MRQGIFVFALKLLGAGLAFLFQVAVARYLGASGAGIFFLAFTVISLASIAARLGMDNSVTRFVAAHASENDWVKVKSVVRLTIAITLAISCFATGVLFFLGDAISANIFGKTELASPLKMMSLLITPIALFWIYANALQGIRKFRDAVLIQSVIVPLIACLALYVFAHRLGMLGAIASYGIGVLVALIFGFWGWQREAAGWKHLSFGFSYQVLLSASIPLLMATLLHNFLLALPLLMLGLWGSSADVGIFNAAQRTAGLVSLVLIAVNTTLSPRFAELYAQRDIIALKRLAQQGQAAALGAAMPILLVFFAAPEWVMSFYGLDFSTGWWLLVIISIGQLVNVATGSVDSLLIMTGNERALLKAGILTTVISLSLCLVLVPSFGTAGAAIAFSVSIAVINMLRVYYVWHNLGIKVFSGCLGLIRR